VRPWPYVVETLQYPRAVLEPSNRATCVYCSYIDAEQAQVPPAIVCGPSSHLVVHLEVACYLMSGVQDVCMCVCMCSYRSRQPLCLWPFGLEWVESHLNKKAYRIKVSPTQVDCYEDIIYSIVLYTVYWDFYQEFIIFLYYELLLLLVSTTQAGYYHLTLTLQASL